MHVRATMLLAVGMALGLAAAAGAQEHGSVAGTVRSAGSRLVYRAIVSTVDGRSGVAADSLGRFVLASVPAGRVRLRAHAIGFQARDTVLVVRAGRRARWDVVLEPFRAAGYEENAADRAKAGAIDSVGRGLLRAATPDAAAFGAFGREFFARTLGEADADENTAVSPASAALALSMVLAGARGETASEMARMLEPTAGAAPVRRGAALVAALRDRKDVTLYVANAIWVDDALELQPQFQQKVSADYSATVRAAPLAARSTVDEINRWASTSTRGKITRILDDPLGSGTLFIANAVYFKGKWLDPFETSRTRERDFTLSSGRRVGVPTMERLGRYGYRRAPGHQLLRLPYRGGRMAMYVVLPDSGVTVSALVDRLRGDNWPASLGPDDMRRVSVLLPRFKLETSMNLNATLRALGMRLAFDPMGADFRGLARFRNTRSDANLFVGRAVQKVFVEVNEEGTEAAAVTGMAMVTSAPPPPIDFVLDRPFLFLLRDEVTGADLFVGHVADPRAK